MITEQRMESVGMWERGRASLKGRGFTKKDGICVDGGMFNMLKVKITVPK